MGIGASVANLASTFIGARAAGKAADQQADALSQGISSLGTTLENVREDFQPFVDVGTTDLDDLGQLVTSPERQLEFIEENPFFDALADRATTDLLKNQAARGRLGTGETAEELQKSLLLLGEDLLSRDVNRRFDLANLGFAGASGQAGAEERIGSQVADLIVGRGTAKASGTVGVANQLQQGIGQGTKILNI